MLNNITNCLKFVNATNFIPPYYISLWDNIISHFLYIALYNDYLNKMLTEDKKNRRLKIKKLKRRLKYLFLLQVLSFNIPVITIFFAPIALATSKVTKPIGPAPRISTLELIPTSPRLQACTPTDNGSKRAPSSKLIWSGNLLQKIINTEINFQFCDDTFYQFVSFCIQKELPTQ